MTSAAWLHDVLDHKMISDPVEYNRKEQEMRDFLAARYSQQQVTLIFDIIENVSFSKEVTVRRLHVLIYALIKS